MLDALPAIVERHPEVLYVIAGRTHPQVARREGEEYRLMLERRIVDLGLAEHVELDDRFLAIDELADLLAATDVFVTPYANREQSSSGALTFALAAGCAVVSTPYWYASDMLSSGAGTLVGFGDVGGARRRGLRASSSSPDALAAARAEARTDRRDVRLARRSPRRPRPSCARRSPRRRAARRSRTPGSSSPTSARTTC